ncbi:MAG: hypothetical protein GX958_12735 [Desulfitobacterium sp.]|nr:hypothetical protein [Desulfitobacterium sp.]
MLGKLMKYEIKATARLFLPIFAALLLIAVANRFILGSGSETPTIISMAIYIFIMIGMFVMALFVTIQRFYKNLLSEEGYLMFTLPVRPWQHIISKMLIAMFWVISSTFVAIFSIFIISFRYNSWQNFLQEIGNLQALIAKIGFPFYTISLEIVFSMILGLMSIILILYASMAIGHLFNNHRVLASFGAFILLNILTQILTLFIGEQYSSYIFNVSIMNDTVNQEIYFGNTPLTMAGFASELQTLMLVSIGITILFNLGYFFITNYILSKRLNLE